MKIQQMILLMNARLPLHHLQELLSVPLLHLHSLRHLTEEGGIALRLLWLLHGGLPKIGRILLTWLLWVHRIRLLK